MNCLLINYSGARFSDCDQLEWAGSLAETQYRIAGNFRGVNIRYFRGQTDLHEILT